MATGGMGVGVLPSAMAWPRWVEAAGLAAGDVLEFVPVSYTHLTLPTIYSV